MASPGSGTVGGEQLARSLEVAAASFAPGELADLALTSKIERPLSLLPASPRPSTVRRRTCASP
jgi:hypothetical protein